MDCNKIKCAFFDRDGTINVNFGYVYKIEDLVFVEGTPEIIKLYNELNIPVIVISNQSGIARNLYSEEPMHLFNSFLNKQLKSLYGAHIDAFYFCPHHPDITGNCTCRKPKPGLFYKAAKDWNISLADSVMYGDKESDYLAAKNAGVKEFHLVKSDRNI